MSNSASGGLSKYQEALKRLKGQTQEAAPDFADDPVVAAEPIAPESAVAPEPEPEEDGVLSFLDEIATEHGLTDAPAKAEDAPQPSEAEVGAAPAPEAESVADEPSEDNAMSFLDDIAAEHGLSEATPSAAEADPPASEHEPAAEEMAADSAEEAPTAEEERPEKKSDDSMDAYLKSLNKLKSEKGASGASGGEAEEEEKEQESRSPADALKAARGMMRGAEETAERESAERSQQAAERLKKRASVQEAAEKKPRRVPGLKGVLHEQNECSPCAPAAGRKSKKKTKAKAKPKVKAAARSRLNDLPPSAVKSGVGCALLLLGLALQFAVFLLLDTPFASKDFLGGICAILPVVLVFALAQPETDQDWRAVIGGAAALGLTASLAFALSLATAYSAPLAGNHFVVVAFLQLGILTLMLGPVILMVAAWLHRLELITLTDPLYT